MESVINFLADYYIWFFVAAGVLCFALIGFIVESKKKDKNTFKGESIETSNIPNEPVITGDTVNMEGSAPLNEASQDITPTVEETPVEPTNNEIPKIEETTTMEDTMEINDIPLKEEDKTPIEFYSNPVVNEQPVVNEIPNTEMNTNTTNTNTGINNNPVIEEIPTNNNENIETLNIFEDIK